MPRPKRKGPEFRSSDREVAKKMLREYFQQKGGAEYMRNAQQPSMFQDTKTGEYIARPQGFKKGGKVYAKNGDVLPESTAHPQAAPIRRGFGYGDPGPSPSEQLYGFRDGSENAPDGFRRDDFLGIINDSLPDPVRKLVMAAIGGPMASSDGQKELLSRIQSAIDDPGSTLAGKVIKSVYGPYINTIKKLYGSDDEDKNNYRNGGKIKYEQGGPVGSASSDQKFRVIPEKSPTGQTELRYYIDGRPVPAQQFQQQFYAVGNKPQDLNQLIENSVIASKQGVGAESLISGGSPMEGLMKQYRDALKERNVYREQGAAGIDSLYNARNENYEEMLRRMGG